MASDSPAETLAQKALTLLATGRAITGIGTPTLNGTYGVDQLSQSDIIAIETSLNAGKGFPGGATMFNYPELSGTLHSFSETNFTNFAAAVRDFIYEMQSVISGISTAMSASKATIS